MREHPARPADPAAFAAHPWVPAGAARRREQPGTAARGSLTVSLFDGVRNAIARTVARKEGEQFARKGGPVVDFLKHNKAPIGTAVAGVAAWAASGCGVILGSIDVPALLGVSCSRFTLATAIVGAFLVGAGVIDSDKAAKAKSAAK